MKKYFLFVIFIIGLYSCNIQYKQRYSSIPMSIPKNIDWKAQNIKDSIAYAVKGSLTKESKSFTEN